VTRTVTRTVSRAVTRALPAIEERGRLEIHPTVLRKIVEHAADQVPGTLRHERRLAGIDIGEAGARARVTLGHGDPTAVDVRLELTLQYPGAVRSVVDAVRAKVADELVRLAGRHVRALTVTVAGLRPAHPTAERLH
jgi:uncharacterized alkaline shock family protein YloU